MNVCGGGGFVCFFVVYLFFPFNILCVCSSLCLVSLGVCGVVSVGHAVL